MSSSELQALFSSLRPRSSQDRSSSSPAPAPAQSSRESTSPIPTRDREVVTSRQPPNATAQNLLNLLNFRGSPTTSDVPTTPTDGVLPTTRAAIGITAPKPVSTEPSMTDSLHHSEHKTAKATEVNKTTLNALRSQSPYSSGNVDSASLTAAEPVAPSPQPTPTVLSATDKPVFTYVNPFTALQASRTHTSHNELAEKKITTSTPDAPNSAKMAARKILTPKPRSPRNEPSPQPEAVRLADQKVDVTPQDKPESRQHADQSENLVSIEAEGKALQKHGKTKPTSEIQSALQNANGDDGSGEWEDSDEVWAPRVIPVYNFPIKAFVSLTLQLAARTNNKIREGSVMEISRLKKDFDQLDRSLAAATSKYIGYAFAKHGGLRIIRQDDGIDRHVFKNSHDRIFNVAFCTTSVLGPPSETQAIIGTGISGSVYYATISRQGKDLFEENNLDSECLIFPPFSQADENSAGGQLKTRAKRSSRHPELFAIGRGKYIHIQEPHVARTDPYLMDHQIPQTVNVDHLHKARPVYIKTGKAVKDFTFSDDDCCIVSLDKTGRLRFWDIRNILQDSNVADSGSNFLVVDKPILSLSNVSSEEKSWPTSVLFVDKARPYAKGGALRYVLVGLRQNHTLQLWDIALNKAVQELNFPHENETDGICSICYHPPSGIIVVGHPTRNSLFFVHLSAPKYTLNYQMDQSSYFNRIASKEDSIPTPESTACFSGIREISFADKGDLRSVELLPIQKASDSSKNADTAKNENESSTLFELYVAHSKGVTCLAINREDLGWNADNKVVQAVDAKKEGMVKVQDLKLGSLVEEPMRTKSPPKETQQSTKASKKKAKKAAQAAEEALLSTGDVQQNDTVVNTDRVPISITDSTLQETFKESKKIKKKAFQTNEQPSLKTEARSVSPAKQLSMPVNTSDEATVWSFRANPSNNEFSIEPIKREIQKIEQAIAADFRKEFTILQENISADRSALDQSSLTRQEAIIRLVSSSLSTNVEKSLSRIVTQKIESDVLPALLQSISTQISDILGQQLQQMVGREIKAGLSSSVTRSLENASKTSIPDAIFHHLSLQLEKQLPDIVTRSVTPLCQNIAHTSAEQAATLVHSQLTSHFQKLQADHAADRVKIDKLSQALEGMADTIQAMSESQIAFQEQILRERQQRGPVTSLQTSTGKTSPSTTVLAQPTSVKPKTSAEIEFDDISGMMDQGHYEEGTIKWLQSSQPVELFDRVFVRFTPDYLATDVSPLVAFSVAVTVANSLDNNIERRIEWISSALDAVDASDPEMTDLSQHAPALISAIVQKLESLYMTLAERQHDDPILRPIPSLVKKARGIGSSFLSTGQAV